MPAAPSMQHRESGLTHPRGPFQFGQSFVDQIISDMSVPAGALLLTGEMDCQARDFLFGQGTRFGQSLRRMPVTVPRGEIHPAVYAARVGAEDLFDDAVFLDKIPPVDRAQQSKASNTVADRNLIRGLLLVFRLHQLVNGEAVPRKQLFEPGKGHRQSGATPSEP